MSRFLGMPIEGEPYVPQRYRSAPQLSEQDFNEYVLAVINVPEVRAIGWTQYTPYFNDGSPCVFSVGEPYISLYGIENSEEDYDWMGQDAEENDRHWISSYNTDFKRLIGNTDKVYSGEYPNRTWEYVNDPESAPNPTLLKAFTELDRAMTSGAFNTVLLQMFGDHATVIIDKENSKVVIDEYNHD